MADLRSGSIRRLIIVGSPGAGKTTLAARVAAETGLPLHVLAELADRAARRPDPERRLHEVVARAVRGRRWIVEGTLLSLRPRRDLDRLFALRVARAEAIALFDLPPALCAARVVLRGRPSDYPGLGAIIRDFRRLVLPRIERAIAELAPRARVAVLRSSADVEAFVGGAPMA